MRKTYTNARKNSYERTTRNAFLTKRLLLRAARAGIIKAAESTEAIMRYNVIALNGRIVRRHIDGRIEDIAPINQANLPKGHLFFDE